LDADAALEIGLAEHQGKEGLHVSKQPALVIYGSRLAYHFVISYEGENVGQWWYYVDAHTGELILRYNNIRFAAPDESNGVHTTVSGNRLAGEGGGSVSMTGFYEFFTFSGGSGNYFLYNFDKKWGIYDSKVGDWEQQGSDNWGTTDRHAISCGKNFEDIQKYVSTVLKRDSFDDEGTFARANVHATGSDCPNNAWWAPKTADWHFCDGDGVNYADQCVLDVAAHEFGHAITEQTSELVYQNESGALDESYSDIMGALVEFYYQTDNRGSYPNTSHGTADWLFDEDTAIKKGFTRDLRDPHRGDQPSYYGGTYWYSGSGDYGGVHANLGVQNHAFYLLAEGCSGSCVNDGHSYSPITGIGIEAAGKVTMRANMHYLTSKAEYIDAREAWIDAAADLGYPTDTVKQVWDAVGVKQNDVEAFVTRFYWECLGRKPDPKGLSDWTKGLTDGVHTGADVARHFINSTEFQDKYYSDEEYLEILYYAFFDRPPDPVGWNFWLGELKAGKSRGYVLDGFLRSQEFYDLCWKYGIFPHKVAAFVYRFYDECLDREPDRKGLEDWTKGLLDGVHTGADVARHFINSYEFQSKNFSDEEYIEILYWAFFNRAPDPFGKNFWLGELNAGKDRGYVLEGFLKSDEFRKLCEDYGITPY
jgi:Zn-dependent metalloprotease